MGAGQHISQTLDSPEMMQNSPGRWKVQLLQHRRQEQPTLTQAHVSRHTVHHEQTVPSRRTWSRWLHATPGWLPSSPLDCHVNQNCNQKSRTCMQTWQAHHKFKHNIIHSTVIFRGSVTIFLPFSQRFGKRDISKEKLALTYLPKVGANSDAPPNPRLPQWPSYTSINAILWAPGCIDRQKASFPTNVTITNPLERLL